MTNPNTDDLIASFTEEMSQLKAKAELVQQQIRTANATVSAPDGAATVTVGPGGALVNLTFGERAYQRSPQQLSATVMELIGKAQRQVSAKVVAAFGEMVGENSAAMDVLTEFLPADPAEAEEEQPQAESEWPPAQQQAPDQPPPPRPVPPRPQQPPQFLRPQQPQAPQPPAPPAAEPEPQRRPDPHGPLRGPSRPQHDEEGDDFTNPW
ncbi:MAG TPA: YbaB/EbfC family nucleoid-associated protein [Pseudonocardiaceae bacterium]|jgi:DNA-binding protein YbaB|nr:YbaB/EbfC family nucleoid-associated protein [Pseudonocardiaceae bacterium]